MSGYAHNATYQQLSTISEYFTSVDEKIFIDLRRGKGYTNEIEKLNRDDSNLSVRITLKNGTAKKKKKKKRLWVTGYYQGKYLYSLSNNGLIMNYKEYRVNKQKSAIS